MNPNAHQTEHGLLRELLGSFLVAELESSSGAGGCRWVGCGAGAALYSLLAAHPVDRRGRCRSCRSTGWLGRRRQVCSVFQKAHYWLRQPTHQVQAHLASELGVDIAAPLGAADPEATNMLRRVVLDLGKPPADPIRTSAISPTPRFQAGWPELDHSGTGERPDRSWPRRVPSEDPSPSPGGAVLSLEA